MNYLKNQVGRLETILNAKITDNEILKEVFEFVSDVYNDGLADKLGTTEHPEKFETRPEPVTLDTFL